MMWVDYKDNVNIEMQRNNWTNRWIPIQFVKMFNLPFKVTPGCYIYAYDPTREIEQVLPDFLDPRVVYIGAAGERGILRRTADFTGSILRGFDQRDPENHSILFRGLYRTSSLDNLYVAYNPQPWREAAFDAETDMLDNYELEHSQLPLLNRQHSKATMIIGNLIDGNPADLDQIREFFNLGA